MPEALAFTVDGKAVEVPDEGASLLEVLRDRLGVLGPKDGCSPQGQCGCCTVLVDGQPRVACVTPTARVAGRTVTTVDGLADASRWARAFSECGASQCGFCTPGIITRLSGLAAQRPLDAGAVRQALLAHLCRCTGWQTILEAAGTAEAVETDPAPRDAAAAAARARIEGRAAQAVGPDVALGRAGFADDLAPRDALVAVPSADGGWAVGETLGEARARAGKVQGRRSTLGLRWPLEVPEGAWDRVLVTTWVEPGYLELDASWCAPGGEPVSPLANGGAFGGKMASGVGAAARALADLHGRPVRVLLAREDAVRRGPKRPPLAAGMRADGSGRVRVARTPGIADALRFAARGLEVKEVDLAGPPTSTALRGAGWVEAAVLLASLGPAPDTVRSPDGAVASATLGGDGTVAVTLRCGDPLDEVVLRSYCIGAAHMALGWVRSEGLAVDDAGEVHDLTIRSFGILRAVDMPEVRVTIEPSDGPAVNGSDAVFAAVAAAAWRAEGFPERWPCAAR